MYCSSMKMDGCSVRARPCSVRMGRRRAARWQQFSGAWRAAAPKDKSSFTDVEAGKWYADAITRAAENNIFAGCGKGKFGPDDPIPREQLAATFHRCADYKDVLR